jgi:hypothetical protein
MTVGVRERLGRRMLRPLRQPRRAQIVGVFLGVVAVALLLLWQARNLADYDENLALNMGADIVGALLTIFLITPILRRAQGGRVREHVRLDYEWYTEQVSGATSVVKLLDTFSNILDQPVTRRFLRSVEGAIERSAYVQILLLDPDSLAVQQRERELGDRPGHADVRREILRNLRTLDAFEHALSDKQRRRFEVRLYNASAGVTLYRWDDKVLVSFLTVGRLSGQGPQLEVTVASPLGGFVEQRFEELWHFSKPMDQFMHLPLTLVEADGSARELTCRFVAHEGRHYVMDQHVVTEMARRRDGRLEAFCRPEPAVRYEPVLVDDREIELWTVLREQYAEKYDGRGAAFVLLKPL